MSQYNIDAEEIAKVISLYSKIADPEKRIYAQGYLNGLSATSAVASSHGDSAGQMKPNVPTNQQQTALHSTYRRKG